MHILLYLCALCRINEPGFREVVFSVIIMIIERLNSLEERRIRKECLELLAEGVKAAYLGT